jgi:hypothetical protein
MRPVVYWPLCLLLLVHVLCASCAHRYTRHQTATRTEETTRKWQIAENAASQTQSVSSEKKASSRRTREFDPKTGKLVKDVLEQYQSDGRVQASSASNSHAESTAHDFRSVKASSSSTTKADTRAGWSPWWLLPLVPAAVLAWLLRRRIRSFIPW